MAITLAIDCMGGDHGPQVTLPATFDFLRKNPSCSAILVGQEAVLRAYVTPVAQEFLARVSVRNATEVVDMDEPVASALRGKKDSSMRVAIDLVKEGVAHAAVSAGNTGALMAISRFVLKTLPGIDRPAICTVLPSRRGATYVLDLGANVDCNAEHLLQFGIMGAMLASALEHKERPSVGLLNIGEEDIKGNDIVKRAGELLRQSDLNFFGNVEGNDIFSGTTDVVVCDGFVGNVVLKTCENVAHAMKTWMKKSFTANPLRMMGALCLRGAVKELKQKSDPAVFGGMPLLGVNGVSIIGHGGSSALAVFNGIRVAAESVTHDINHLIVDGIKKLPVSS